MRDENGKVKYDIVWNMIDDKYAPQLALNVLQKEVEVLKPDAIYTDCKRGARLRALLQKLNLRLLPKGQVIRVAHSRLSSPGRSRSRRFEDPRLNFLEAPLLNLVYHDAVVLSNRWQWPDNEYSVHGDYAGGHSGT